MKKYRITIEDRYGSIEADLIEKERRDRTRETHLLIQKARGSDLTRMAMLLERAILDHRRKHRENDNISIFYPALFFDRGVSYRAQAEIKAVFFEI